MSDILCDSDGNSLGLRENGNSNELGTQSTDRGFMENKDVYTASGVTWAGMTSDIVLLETGKITVSSENKMEKNRGILIDRGSSKTYVSRKLANDLELEVMGKCAMRVNSFGGHTFRKIYDVSYVDIHCIDGINTVEILIEDELIKPINQNGWIQCLKYPYIRNLTRLANDFQDDRLAIDILLGSDHLYEFMDNDLIKGDGPVAQGSTLGYFIAGPLVKKRVNKATTSYSAAARCDWEELDPEIEYLNAYMRSQCVDDNHVDLNFEENFKKEYLDSIQFKDGKYYVSLPWKTDHPELPSNLEACQRRIKQVMARLRKLDLVEAYVKVMQENIQKEYISELKPGDTDGYFMPHFPVLRQSETTPVRIVFDASSGTVSLNDCLYEGPNMIQDLVQLIMRFRTKKIAFTADIARAFLSVRLKEADRKWVKFLWYRDNDVTKELVPYCANTVIFGNVSSPFALAITLEKHLSSFGDDWVANDMSEKLYVDNLLSGVDTVAEMRQYYHKANKIMDNGGFKLRQWASNCPELNETAKSEENHVKADLVTILGLKWNPDSDLITLGKKEFDDLPLTKRIVTSRTASIYDPLGFVGPIIVPAKKFVNNLWIDEKSWDEKLSAKESESWNDIENSLVRCSEVRIPRWLNGTKDEKFEIMVLCDACPQSAIGCVAYAKIGDEISLLGSKNKIVSKKNENLTVPKLELMAMVMGAQYGNWLTKTFGKVYSEVKVTYATDSEIALHWLNSGKKLKQFVNNRVETIKQNSDIQSWHHVDTKNNTADVLSRGMTYKELADSDWVTGPAWLKGEVSTWPLTHISKLAEPITTACCFHASAEYDNEFQMPATHEWSVGGAITLERYSKLDKLLRVTAYCKKVFKKQRNLPLTAEDINEAEHTWLLHVQKNSFGDILAYLQAKNDKRKKLPKRPNIVAQLGLFIDEKDNLIRCGGRMQNANITYGSKHPILLPQKSHLTKLIIEDTHHRMVHYRDRITMNTLRKKYWIVGMRVVVHKILKGCVVCQKVNAKAYPKPENAPLPSWRLNNLRPFQATTMDFTSHLFIRFGNSVKKSFVCLFTCATTRAVHLELVPDMSTQSFLRAFRRFTSTFSVPQLLYCDNAKTFIAGKNEIQRIYNMLTDAKVQKHFAEQRVIFKFMPVEASWFGGVHERLIGVTKSALKKVLGRACVAYDELQTILKEIQSVINNRPLTYLSIDPDELSPLTPNQLIFGKDTELLPEVTEEKDFDPTYGVKRSDLEQIAHNRGKLLRNFRERFKDEYLAGLRERHRHEIRNRELKQDIIKVGDVVHIHSKDDPRIKWKLGLVVELQKSEDGFIRSATVKSKSGLSRRAIGKLYPLEINAGDVSDFAPKRNFAPNVTVSSRPFRKAADIAKKRITEQMRYEAVSLILETVIDGE